MIAILHCKVTTSNSLIAYANSHFQIHVKSQNTLQIITQKIHPEESMKD